jgi:integrase
MPRQNLTDRFIRSRKPALLGKRDDFLDAVVPGLALRVTDRGHKSFVLIARYPSNPKHPTRRALGDCYIPPRAKEEDDKDDKDEDRFLDREIRSGALTLAEARVKGRVWLDLISRGVDPCADEARQQAEARRRRINTFAIVAAEFLERHASGLKKSGEAHRIVNSEFVKRWGPRPATDIMPEEVAAAICAIVKRGAPYQAHNALGYIRRLFNWAIGTHEFGIQTSPVTQLKPKDLIGKRRSRKRTLTNDELRAVWKAADAMDYPYGPLFRLLILNCAGAAAHQIRAGC